MFFNYKFSFSFLILIFNWPSSHFMCFLRFIFLIVSIICVVSCSATTKDLNKTWNVVDIVLICCVIRVWSYASLNHLLLFSHLCACHWSFTVNVHFVYVYVLLLIVVSASDFSWCLWFFIRAYSCSFDVVVWLRWTSCAWLSLCLPRVHYCFLHTSWSVVLGELVLSCFRSIVVGIRCICWCQFSSCGSILDLVV